MYVVTVEFQLHDGAGGAFLPLVCRNAEQSLAEEPACLRFDVCVDPDRAERVFLYELYLDRAAFERHLDMPHFKAFDAEAAALVAAKSVTTYQRVAP